MNHHFRSYFSSLRLKTAYWYTFTLDVITVAVITTLVVSLGRLLQGQALAISGGKSPEEFKVWLLSASLETSQQLLQQIKNLTYLFVGGVLLLLVLSLLLLALTQSLSWATLRRVRWQHYWRWCGLMLLLIFFLLVYLLFYSLLRLILNISPLTATVPLLTKMIAFIFLVLFFIFFFLVGYAFSSRHKVWGSVGAAFQLLRENLAALGIFFLLAVATGFILNLLLSLLYRSVVVSPIGMMLINIAVLLLFLAWLRTYLLQSLAETEQKIHLSSQHF